MASRRGGGGVAAPTETTRLVGSSTSTFGTAPAHYHDHHQQEHPRHHPHYPYQEVDPVERMVKRGLVGTALFLLFSFVGVLCLILKALGFDRLPWIARLPPAARSYWVVFSPFWLADTAGLAAVLATIFGVCTLRTATREDRRHGARAGGGGGGARRHTKLVSMELFPLVQTLLRRAAAALPFLLCLAALQVLLCLAMEHQLPAVQLWVALLPFMAFEALALLGTLCLRTGSLVQALGWALALAATAALALRFSPGAWPFPPDSAWSPLWVAFTPLWALQLLGLLLLAYVAAQGGRCTGRFLLNAHHVACMVLYAVALVLLTAAELLFIWRRTWEDLLNADFPHLEPGVADAMAGIALFCAVGLACLALYLLAAEDADHLVTSHGYEDPMPLSRTAKGWEPTGARVGSWLLLGRIEETARLARRAGPGVGGIGMGTLGIGMKKKKGAAGGGRAGGRGEGDSPVRQPQGGEGGPLRRSNSGSYADLYEDLEESIG